MNLPPNGGSIFGVSGRLDDLLGTQVYYIRADLTDTSGAGGTLTGTLHEIGPVTTPTPAYEVRGIYTDTPSPSANSRFGTFSARIYPVGSLAAVGSITGKWGDRLSVDLIG
ncbi:MAG: hypothetical protein GY713_06650, partial [Actinomycetia bacterium]|nr:hypothetical protein [Actinomycetes bacterium]